MTGKEVGVCEFVEVAAPPRPLSVANQVQVSADGQVHALLLRCPEQAGTKDGDEASRFEGIRRFLWQVSKSIWAQSSNRQSVKLADALIRLRLLETE